MGVFGLVKIAGMVLGGLMLSALAILLLAVPSWAHTPEGIGISLIVILIGYILVNQD